MDTINGEGQSSHVPVFCLSFEWHICSHITTIIKCYLHSLRYVYVPFTNISCQSNMYIFEPVFINVNKPSMLQSYLQKKFLVCKSNLVEQHMYCKLDTSTRVALIWDGHQFGTLFTFGDNKLSV